MKRSQWIGARGEELDRDRLAIWRAGLGGKVIDRRNEYVGYDWEVRRFNIYTHQWEVERHETKTKSARSQNYPGLTPNEKRAQERYGDEYHIDRTDLPYFMERHYDNWVGGR
jgi:hypothetical protein